MDGSLHGESGITIGIPADWKFTMGAGAVDGSTQYMSKGGMPVTVALWLGRPDFRYLVIATPIIFALMEAVLRRSAASLYGGGGGNNCQQEVLATAAHGEWTGISARFDGWVGVGWSDTAFSYLAVKNTERGA